MLNRHATGLLSVVMAAVLLIVGLWPFKFRPPNQVHWIEARPGLSFQPDGVVYDSEPADWSAGGSPDQPASFTLELWLQPAREPESDVFHILAIDDGQFPSGTVLCQWGTEFLLRVRDSANDRGFREVGVSGALAEQTPRFITITAGPAETAFYLDGLPFNRFPGFVVPGSRLTRSGTVA